MNRPPLAVQPTSQQPTQSIAGGATNAQPAAGGVNVAQMLQSLNPNQFSNLVGLLGQGVLFVMH